MVLPASGAIGLVQCLAEFGLSSGAGLGALHGQGGAPASGAIGLSDMYGRTGAQPISADEYFAYINGYSLNKQSHITATGGKTIASITLVAGAASPRINPGASGGATTTGTVSTPATGTGVVQATYRYTTNTGEFVEVTYSAEWGT